MFFSLIYGRSSVVGLLKTTCMNTSVTNDEAKNLSN